MYVKVHALRKTSLSLSCLYLTPYYISDYILRNTALGIPKIVEEIFGKRRSRLINLAKRFNRFGDKRANFDELVSNPLFTICDYARNVLI